MTQWTRDLEGRVVAKKIPDTTQATVTFENTTSRVHQTQDALGRAALYAYNGDDTLSGVTFTPASGVAFTPKESFTYDPIYSRVKTMVDGTGTTTYTYNPAIAAANLPTTEVNELGSISVPVSLGNGTVAVTPAAIAQVNSPGVAKSSKLPCGRCIPTAMLVPNAPRQQACWSATP